MRMKSKITYGLGFLFLLLFLVCGFSIYFFSKLSSDAKAIIKDNYQSVEYSYQMLNSVEKLNEKMILYNLGSPDSRNQMKDNFINSSGVYLNEMDKNLKAEEANITEQNEYGYFISLKSNYNQIKQMIKTLSEEPANSQPIEMSQWLSLVDNIRTDIHRIYQVNMKAILNKSDLAKKESEHINSAMAAIITVCFILALFYYLYFPYYISNTLVEISNRMKAIIKNNFSTKMDIRVNDEFGEITESFDKLVDVIQKNKESK